MHKIHISIPSSFVQDNLDKSRAVSSELDLVSKQLKEEMKKRESTEAQLKSTSAELKTTENLFEVWKW